MPDYFSCLGALEEGENPRQGVEMTDFVLEVPGGTEAPNPRPPSPKAGSAPVIGDDSSDLDLGMNPMESLPSSWPHTYMA